MKNCVEFIGGNLTNYTEGAIAAGPPVSQVDVNGLITNINIDYTPLSHLNISYWENKIPGLDEKYPLFASFLNGEYL